MKSEILLLIIKVFDKLIVILFSLFKNKLIHKFINNIINILVFPFLLLRIDY